MPRTISGQRIARSFVTPTGSANEVQRVLDFNLAADQGIEIEAVLGYGNYFDASPAPSDTVPISNMGFQTLHLETGATEDLPSEAAEDADDIDSEIFYVQSYAYNAVLGTTNTFGGGASLAITPSGIWIPPEPILSPRNIIHKGRTNVTDTFGFFGVIIYYKFVSLTPAELGVALARR